jgi:alkanesulfonate monooxygenase SsuD/methylene tetrahydromethanopterin reductase-like flavin-dependent oxidoreductase (luciferase family)
VALRGAAVHRVRAVRFGVLLLPEFPWREARSRWRGVEELGFDHAWTYDHLAWRTLRDGTWFGAVPFLGAAALVTETLRLGTLVASPNFRHPVPFARELVTLDDLSGGRLTLGIGAGSEGWDAAMLGQSWWSPAERAGRFAEFVELLDRLLREPETSYDGRFYRAVDARTYPGCVQRPRVPFAVAGTGRRGMRLAATYGDTWVTTGALADDGARLGADEGARVVREQMARLDEVCHAAGRDPTTISRLVLTGPSLDPGLSSIGAFDHTAARYAEAGVTDLVVHWPRPEEPYAGDRGTFEAIFSELASRPRAPGRIRG